VLIKFSLTDKNSH